MTRKLHRRSAQQTYFPKGEKEGGYVRLNRGDCGTRARLEDARQELWQGMHGNPDGVQYHRADEVLRLIEAGFDDEAIAEFMLMPVEDVQRIIDNDLQCELSSREKIALLLS